jgi:hypothetical protein
MNSPRGKGWRTICPQCDRPFWFSGDTFTLRAVLDDESMPELCDCGTPMLSVVQVRMSK